MRGIKIIAAVTVLVWEGLACARSSTAPRNTMAKLAHRNWLNKDIYLVTLLSFAGCASAFAQECLPRHEEWVIACSNLSTTAQWNEDSENECLYNPPPGFVIVEAVQDVLSSNNGSSEVDVVAAGSEFATERDFESARSALLQMSGKFEGKDYSALIDSRVNAAKRSSVQFRSTNNAVHATVSASGSGNWWDRKRGWQAINVRARLRCLGVPDVSLLTEQFAMEVGMPLLAPAIIYFYGCDNGWAAYASARQPNGKLAHPYKLSSDYDSVYFGETISDEAWIYIENGSKQSVIAGSPSHSGDVLLDLSEAIVPNPLYSWRPQPRPVYFKYAHMSKDADVKYTRRRLNVRCH
jgi:hypothetical protein